MSNLKTSLNNFEVALSEFTTSLHGAMSEVEKSKRPDACQCKHCVSNLERLEGQTIPMLNGQIAAIRGAMAQLRDGIDSEGL